MQIQKNKMSLFRKKVKPVALRSNEFGLFLGQALMNVDIKGRSIRKR